VAFLIPTLRDFVPAAAAVLAFSLVRSPLIPIANSFTLRALGRSPEAYAGVRLWGTIGYIGAAVVAGSLMDRVGLARGIYGIGLAMLACAVTAWAGRSRERLVLPPACLRDIGGVLGDRRLQRLLLAAGLARLSVGPYETFFTIHLGQLGLSRTFAGAAWALAAASELAVMLAWRRLSALAGPRTWLTLALGAHAVRWGLLAAAAGPVSLLAIQLTHALTFGAFYLAAVQEVDAAAPDGLRATAQGAFSSVTFALGGFLGDTLSGLLYEPLGMRGLYVAACAVAAAATAVYAAGARPVRGAGA
jgi:PPP family 3-phenylpropionic acid transporter